MAASVPLRLDVSEILDRPGASRSVSGRVVVPAAGACPESEIDAGLNVSAIPDGLVVHGTLSGVAHTACSRCLDPISIDIDVEITEAFLEPGEETDDAEAYPIEGAEVDLEPVIREAVILAIPAYPKCQEDCPGLCQQCGTDLRTSSCQCEISETDPRLAVLSTLDLRQKD